MMTKMKKAADEEAMKRKKQCSKCSLYLQALGYCTYGDDPVAIAERPSCPIIINDLERERAEHLERAREINSAYAKRLYKDIVQPWLARHKYTVDWLPDGRLLFIDQAGHEYEMRDLREAEDYREMCGYLLRAAENTELCPNQYPNPLFWVIDEVLGRREEELYAQA
jgi:hypothetical protein